MFTSHSVIFIHLTAVDGQIVFRKYLMARLYEVQFSCTVNIGTQAGIDHLNAKLGSFTRRVTTTHQEEGYIIFSSLKTELLLCFVLMSTHLPKEK